MMGEPRKIMTAEELYHVYKSDAEDGNVTALKGLYFHIYEGEIVTIVGPSGSGKSTLLKCIGGLMSPSSGKVKFLGKSLHNLPEKEKLILRQQTVSYVFQDSGLLPHLNIINNVALPLKHWGINPRKARKDAMALLERLGIGDKAKNFPNQVSGGEKQRAAIARALITKPRMVLADEPTGSVDPVTSREIHKLFKELNAESGISFLIVTHSKTTASISHRSMELVDGRFVAQHEDVDVTDLESSRKILIDESGRLSIPQEILASTGGPGMFELISNDKNEIKLIRHLSNDKESELKERLVEKCIACGYQFTSMDESQCSSCGALR